MFDRPSPPFSGVREKYRQGAAGDRSNRRCSGREKAAGTKIFLKFHGMTRGPLNARALRRRRSAYMGQYPAFMGFDRITHLDVKNGGLVDRLREVEMYRRTNARYRSLPGYRKWFRLVRTNQLKYRLLTDYLRNAEISRRDRRNVREDHYGDLICNQRRWNMRRRRTLSAGEMRRTVSALSREYNRHLNRFLAGCSVHMRHLLTPGRRPDVLPETQTDIPVSFGASCADWEDTNSEGLRQVSFQNAINKAGVSLDDMNAEVQLTLDSRFLASEADEAHTMITSLLSQMTQQFREIYHESSRFYSLGGQSEAKLGHRASNYLFVNSSRQALFLNISGFSRGGPQWREERLSFIFHARGPEAFAQAFIAEMIPLLEPYKNQEQDQTEDSVEIHNCVRDPQGGVSMYPHDYDYPYRWETMRANYTEANQSILTDLVQNPLKFDDGRLIILYGSPGTGKTWFIRSLVREWKSQYLPIVVQDVENFMSDETYYMNLLQQSDSVNPEKKAPLIILEDAGQSLIRNGQYGVIPIQRLLNRTDGLCIGDRNATFLITFNEDLGEIDAAIVREGRCRASVEFRPLLIPEAIQWLTNHERPDLTELATSPMSIAQLYGMIRNYNGQPDRSVLARDQSTGKKLNIGF